MKKVLILTVLLVSVLALGFAQTALSGTYRYSTNAYITFTGGNFTGSWNAATPISGTYSVSGSRLTLNITGGPRARNTWTWTIVDANTLRDQDGDSWRKEVTSGPSFIKSESGDTIAQVSNFAEAMDWLKIFAQSNTSYIIEVGADESIASQTLSFSGKSGIIITLRGVGSNRTLSNSFSVGSGVTLVLDDNITLRRGRVVVNSGGILIMNNGSTITGNTADLGGGVYVDGGNFTMNGGTISGNTANTSGGGVYVRNGTFTMNGGKISGNTASRGNGGGVYVDLGTLNETNWVFEGQGFFTMNGGEISGNTANGYTIQGYTANDPTVRDFTVDGDGGGVYGYGWTMSGGIISGNTAGRNGGGVEGRLTMSNGTISDNTARGNGGGVSGYGWTMSGGIISGNTASDYGGGVYVGSNGTFTMSGGEISGNTASDYGGGVYVGSNGTFTMSGGTISGNTARENGGGVYVRSNGTFTKTGGTINGYSAGDTNSNVVKNSSGAVQNFRGHAVWAGSTETLLKIRESTAGPGDNMSYGYDSRTEQPTASGAWDN